MILTCGFSFSFKLDEGGGGEERKRGVLCPTMQSDLPVSKAAKRATSEIDFRITMTLTRWMGKGEGRKTAPWTQGLDDCVRCQTPETLIDFQFHGLVVACAYDGFVHISQFTAEESWEKLNKLPSWSVASFVTPGPRQKHVDSTVQDSDYD